MTQSSDFGGRIKFATTHGLQADDPMSTQYAGTVFNNLQHFSDQVGQVRVSAMAASAPWMPPYGINNTALDLDTWYTLAAFGPFPLTLDETGIPYPLRCRMRVINNIASTATYRLVVTPMTDLFSDLASEASTATTHMLEFNTAATAAAVWMTGASSTLLTWSGAKTGRGRVRWGTIDAISGDGVSYDAVMAMAVVYGKTLSHSWTRPGLLGLYLAEVY